MITGAEGIIMATPVYNGGLSAQLKAVMDRCRALGAIDFDFMRYKVGMAIAVGGDRIGGQEFAIQQITNILYPYRSDTCQWWSITVLIWVPISGHRNFKGSKRR